MYKRQHQLPQDILTSRAERLLNLKSLGVDPLVYVFTTIMRSPKASSAPVEPAYYAEWGPIYKCGNQPACKKLVQTIYLCRTAAAGPR